MVEILYKQRTVIIMKNEFLNDQIEEIEDMCGTLTTEEKNKLTNEFMNKYQKLADAVNMKIEKIINNYELMFELNQWIDYDFETAKKIAVSSL